MLSSGESPKRQSEGDKPAEQEQNSPKREDEVKESAQQELPPPQKAKKRSLSESTEEDDNDNDDGVQSQESNKGSRHEDETSPRKKAARRDTADSEQIQNDDTAAKPRNKAFSAFGGDKDDWSEFAEEEQQAKPAAPAATAATKNNKEEGPKYMFGTTSGFGTKAWTQAGPAAGTTSQKSTFGGFSGFGAFASSSSTSTGTTSSSFASFANASASPFALAAAASPNKDALSALPKQSSCCGNQSSDNDNESAATTSENADDEGAAATTKTKLANIKPAEVKTGEEDEQTVYQTKAKLYVLDTASGNWKERGIGTMRINTKETEKGTTQTRIVMRADSVYRLILNLPLFPGMEFVIMQEKYVRFAGFETTEAKETSLVNFALKVASASAARELQSRLMSSVPAPTNNTD